MKKVRAMYFSGTSTTERVCKAAAGTMARELGRETDIIDFSSPKVREQTISFTEEDIVVFGVPVYAGRVPNVLLKFIKTVEGNGAKAVPVVLFGNRNFDDGLIELYTLLKEDGFEPVAAGAFVGEHSFSRILAAGRPDDEDMEEVRTFATKAAAKITAMENGEHFQPLKVKGETPIRDYYKPRDRHGKFIDIRKVKPKINENCVECGYCAEICPMGSINPDNIREFTGICIKCCACEKKCPQGARYFDDPGYLYHKTELEEMYARRAKNEIFL